MDAESQDDVLEAVRKARELGLDMERFPALLRYAVYVATYEAVDLSRVSEEMEAIEAEIKEPINMRISQCIGCLDFPCQDVKQSRYIIPDIDIDPRKVFWRLQFVIGTTSHTMRMLGKEEMQEFLRLIGMNIHDEVTERFDNALLKGAVSLDAVLGTHLGPRSPNTIMTCGNYMSFMLIS